MITGKDISTMMDLLVSAYGEKSFPTDPKQMTQVANLWSVMFKDDEPEEVLLAVKNCIATLSFPPRIADIKSRIAQSRTKQMTEMEAWSAIREAVRNSSSRTDANEAFVKLPPILQKCVGTPSQLRAWNGVSVDTFEGVIASNIQRSYRESAKYELTYYSLPKDMQASQNWMVEQKSEVQMLPEPAPQKSLDEVEADRIKSEIEYREKYLLDKLRASNEKVEKFKNPTEAEWKMMEAKKRHEEKMRTNSWR